MLSNPLFLFLLNFRLLLHSPSTPYPLDPPPAPPPAPPPHHHHRHHHPHHHHHHHHYHTPRWSPSWTNMYPFIIVANAIAD